MRIIIRESQKDTVLFRLFDLYFDKSEFVKYKNPDDGNEVWEGFVFYEDDNLEIPTCLVCKPLEGDVWYSNGFIFSDFFEFFKLDGYQFNEKLSEYITKKYKMNLGTIN